MKLSKDLAVNYTTLIMLLVHSKTWICHPNVKYGPNLPSWIMVVNNGWPVLLELIMMSVRLTFDLLDIKSFYPIRKLQEIPSEVTNVVQKYKKLIFEQK